MNWSDLFAALAQYLVREGIMPFLNPQGVKRLMLTFASLADRQLRVMGLVSMCIGLTLLYFVRS
jgi:uncharacterized protein YjeT (DUF2065 family)